VLLLLVVTQMLLLLLLLLLTGLGCLRAVQLLLAPCYCRVQHLRLTAAPHSPAAAAPLQACLHHWCCCSHCLLPLLLLPAVYAEW
jgi:hypothetical protein